MKTKSLRSRVFKYFVYTGVIFHVLLIGVVVWQPSLVNKLVSLPVSYYYNQSAVRELDKHSLVLQKTIEQQIASAFLAWQPLPNYSNTQAKQSVGVNGVLFTSLSDALKVLKAGDELQFYQGVFNTPFLINKDDITIVGYGHVVFEKAAYRGKGFVVSTAKNLTIKNIECRYIEVADENGACVRQEGTGLSLEHVYFHHSENGVLEGSKNPGNIYISDSRFELLGKNGQAHGIYSNTSNIFIHDSLFIASKDEGHAIKNRGEITDVSNSIITSMSSNDSRLIDIPNGGKLHVTNSLLHQGLLSANGQAIGFALEGGKYQENSISITNSIILLERIKQNVLLANGVDGVDINIRGNIYIDKDPIDTYSENILFENRQDANLPEYPYFPKTFCDKWHYCPFNL